MKINEHSLVTSWEEVYKKGQLTLWVLLALFNGGKKMEEIKDFIERATKGLFSVDDKSMYRALRRYYDADLVEFEFKVNTGGPDWKIYKLTNLGKEVLGHFVKRNITGVLFQPEIKKLLERSVR